MQHKKKAINIEGDIVRGQHRKNIKKAIQKKGKIEIK